MSNFYQKKIARESLEGTTAEDNLSNIETPEENLESNLEELASEDAQLDTLMRDGESLDSDMAKTEDAVDLAEDTLDDGDELTETAAETIEISQESIRKRWGITRVRLGRESFRNGNRGSTRIAHEGWKETLKDLWTRLLALIESIINRAKDLKLKVMNVGKSAVSRSKKYEDILSKLGGKKKKDKISGGWMGKLAIEGKVDPGTSGDIAVKLVTGGKTTSAGAALTKQIEASASYAVSSEDGNATFTNYAGVDMEFDGAVAKHLKVLPGFENDDGGGSVTPHNIYALPGNGYIQSAKKEIVTGSNGEKSPMIMVAFFSAGEKVDDKEYSTPAVTELRKANSQLKKIGENYEKILNDFRKSDAAVTKLKDAVKKTISNFDKSKDENRNALRAARQIAQASLTSVTALNKALHGTVRTVISGLSGFIGAGIGAYEKA